MSQAEILSEIERLSIFQQLDLIKEAMRILEKQLHGTVQAQDEQLGNKVSLTDAATLLLADYEEDEELTAFSSLDGEEFYATR